MCKNYKCAPLPFMGQKRYFIRDFSEVLKQVAGQIDTVVDLFGGSGLLSYTAKKVLPGCRVIYNDFDHYDRRLAAVEDTNAMLANCEDSDEHSEELAAFNRFRNEAKKAVDDFLSRCNNQQ